MSAMQHLFARLGDFTHRWILRDWIPSEEPWPPTEIFGPELLQFCHGKRMRYVGINFYGDEPDKDLHLWVCEKCGEIRESEAKLTEEGTAMLHQRLRGNSEIA